MVACSLAIEIAPTYGGFEWDVGTGVGDNSEQKELAQSPKQSALTLISGLVKVVGLVRGCKKCARTEAQQCGSDYGVVTALLCLDRMWCPNFHGWEEAWQVRK